MNKTANRLAAGALIPALMITPSFAQTAHVEPVTIKQDSPYLLDHVTDESKNYAGVVIAIYKGTKEKMLTVDQIGSKFVEIFHNQFNTPAKYEAQPGGDYTAIVFAINGHVYGPYGLNESLSHAVVAADNYQSKVRQGIFPRIASNAPEAHN